jgi:flagellar basal body-associated protein FliL
MAEKQTVEQPHASKGAAGVSVMIVLTVIGVIAVGAGLATPYLVRKTLGSKAIVAEDKRDNVRLSTSEGNEMAFIPFGEVVVNLNDGRMNRYLRLNLTVQVEKRDLEETKKQLDKNKVILKDWLLRYLSDKQMDEIRGTACQNRLRREILDQFNTVLYPDGYERLHDALFEEFNVQ